MIKKEVEQKDWYKTVGRRISWHRAEGNPSRLSSTRLYPKFVFISSIFSALLPSSHPSRSSNARLYILGGLFLVYILDFEYKIKYMYIMLSTVCFFMGISYSMAMNT